MEYERSVTQLDLRYYEQCDRMEYESSATQLDLRYVLWGMWEVRKWYNAPLTAPGALSKISMMRHPSAPLLCAVLCAALLRPRFHSELLRQERRYLWPRKNTVCEYQDARSKYENKMAYGSGKMYRLRVAKKAFASGKIYPLRVEQRPWKTGVCEGWNVSFASGKSIICYSVNKYSQWKSNCKSPGCVLFRNRIVYIVHHGYNMVPLV